MPTVLNPSSSPSFVTRWKNSSRRANALLFAGPAGAGKKAAAEAVAADVLETRAPNHPDLIRIVPEKNAIKIETVRELLGRLSLKPVQAGRIVVIIEDCDAMTAGAANALLKTLEEPPTYVLFLLLTSRPEELPATVRSRCQRVRFQVPLEALHVRLQESYASWEAELAPLWAPARAPFAAASRLAETVKEEKDRLDSFFEILKALWHDAGVLKTGGAPASLLVPPARGRLEALASRKDPERIFEDMDLIVETERALEGNVNKTLALERMFHGLIG